MRSVGGIWLSASTLLLLVSPPADAQLFSFGVKAGVPLTSTYTTQFISDGGASAGQQRFTIGPTAEVHLPFHLSIEVDALWRQSSFSEIGANINYRHLSVNDWQFPILAKYQRTAGPIHPFIDGGIVYRHVSTDSPPPPTNPNTAGVAVGGGAMLKLWRLRISPELRYTRWTTRSFSSNYTGPVIGKSNQADLLVGFAF